ncbi:MAG: 6,7-dimethyl-8-ribityllumazine synthase [Polyangiales bacterium]
MSADDNAPSAPLELPVGARFAIVWSRFNRHVVHALVEGARACLEEHGIAEDAIDVYEVPGAWELSHAANRLAQGGTFDAIIALGAVIRGGTPHFDYVCNGATQGLLEVMLRTGVPVAFGVLTTDDDAQALARAGGDHGNKGRDAAMTAIEMVLFDRKLEADGVTAQGA